MSSQKYVIDYFLSKDHAQMLKQESILSFNYLENNFFTSIEFIEMISHFEDYFDIEFLDIHFKDVIFYKIGTLIKLIDTLAEERPAC